MGTRFHIIRRGPAGREAVPSTGRAPEVGEPTECTIEGMHAVTAADGIAAMSAEPGAARRGSR